MSCLFRFVSTSVLLCVLSVGLLAQDGALPSIELEQRVTRAFDRADYDEAARLIEAFLEKSPRDPIMLYNGACAYARLGKLDKAGDYLFSSVERGFLDFDHMERDPDLDNLREHPVYVRIMGMRDEAYERIATRQIEFAKEHFGEEGYRYETDSERRLNYVTALDDVSHSEMKSMLERQADHLAEFLFDGTPSYYTLIAVPTPAMARRMINDPSIGGLYEHPKRRLLARDIGVMLKHEFTHLMHYGHMEKLDQPHALWVQEGIATLYESYELDSQNNVTFKVNNRHNIVKRLVSANRSFPWQRLLAMSPEQFMGRAGQAYPQVRSMFRWLADREQLVPWYQAYVESFEEDPSGQRAFGMIFDEPLEDTERRWRNWVKSQPMRDEWVTRGDASLGISTSDDSSNDGVVVQTVVRGSGASRAGLRVGDVIVAIDGIPTRSFPELVEIIASKQVDEGVRVRFRRAGRYDEVVVILRPSRLEARVMPTEDQPWRAAA